MRLEFMFCPTLHSTDITIVRNKTAFSNENYVISCEQLFDKTVRCSPFEGTYRYNETTNILYYNFTFNHARHDGTFLRIKTNTSCSTEDVQFYPLKQRMSGFNGSATFNKTHVSVQCKHDSCDVSTAEIHITGRNASCGNSTRLPKGLNCDMEYRYNSNETISCVLDGITYNITNITFVQGNTNGQGRCNQDRQQLILVLLMFSIAII
ncbi:uncharacterized protein LOC144623166 [Crassostrea virginica]